MNDVALWVGLGGLVLGGAWFGVTQVTQGNLEEPAFEVLQTEHHFQLRHYAPVVLASTAMSRDSETDMSNGFRVLARYIFGGNKPAESLPMTAPVLTRSGGESLAMTVPVLTSESVTAPSVTHRGRSMAFVMPRGRSIQSLPQPLTSKVELSQVQWGHVASLRYGGYAKPERFNAQTKRLRSWIKQQGWTERGPAMNAQYNSPWAFPLSRRNEVLIPVDVPRTNAK